MDFINGYNAAVIVFGQVPLRVVGWGTNGAWDGVRMLCVPGPKPPAMHRCAPLPCRDSISAMQGFDLHVHVYKHCILAVLTLHTHVYKHVMHLGCC